MKLLLSLFLLLFAIKSSAQIIHTKNGLRVAAVQLTFGASTDQYKGFNKDDVASTAIDPSKLDFDLDGLEPTFGKRSVAFSMFTSLILSPNELNNTSIFNRSEWLIGLGFHSAREMRAGYSSESLDTTINFCNFSNERSIELAYMVNFFSDNTAKLYAGLGTNASLSHNNEVMVIGGQFIGNDEHPSLIFSRPESQIRLEAKPIFRSRIFAVLGINMHRSSRMDFNFQYRPGIGIKYLPDQGAKLLPYTGGFNLGWRFYFNQRDVETSRLLRIGLFG
jgi:hypothetical protein